MLHRPYIRQEVRQEVENRAQKNNKGQFLDANTQKPIDGKYDLGHKPGHEFWREAEKAEKEGLTQEQFNNRMNNPDLYHIESPHENRSHSHEMPKTQTNNTQTPQSSAKGGKQAMGRNEFLDSVKVDKATIDKTNQVSRNAAKTMNSQSGKKGGLDSGGRERGDSSNAPLSQGRESGNKAGPAPTSHSSPSQGRSSNGQGNSDGHASGGQAASSGHGSGGVSSGGGHSSGGSGTGGHGSGGQGGSGGHGSSGGSGGHGGH